MDDVEVEVDAGRESTLYEYERNGVGTDNGSSIGRIGSLLDLDLYDCRRRRWHSTTGMANMIVRDRRIYVLMIEVFIVIIWCRGGYV